MYLYAVIIVTATGTNTITVTAATSAVEAVALVSRENPDASVECLYGPEAAWNLLEASKAVSAVAKKDSIISMYRKFQSWRRYRGYQKEWDYQEQGVFEGAPEVTEEDYEEEMYKFFEWSLQTHLKNKVCLVSDTYSCNNTDKRIMCSKCVLDSAEFIKVVDWNTTESCAVCGHKNGEEFPDDKEE